MENLSSFPKNKWCKALFQLFLLSISLFGYGKKYFIVFLPDKFLIIIKDPPGEEILKHWA